MVLRRGTGGYLTNGIVARWQRQGLSVRDPETNDLLTADSLNVVNMLLAENTRELRRDGGDQLRSRRRSFAAENHVASAATAAILFTSLTPATLDWTPAARLPAASGRGHGGDSGRLHRQLTSAAR